MKRILRGLERIGVAALAAGLLGSGRPGIAETSAPTARGEDAHDWSFGGTWPYKPHWLDTDGIRIHYVDEGPRHGEAVVMLHVHPAWSYVYRNFIQGLAQAGHRAIAHDQIGFGRSDKPERQEDYTIQRNVEHFGALMDALALDRVTLVLHDFGGPLGLAWAVENPDRVERLVILNTFAGSIPAGVDRGALLWIRIMGAPALGELLVKGARLPVRLFLLRMGIFHRERIGENERAAYLSPHPTWASRAGLLAYPRLWPFDEHSPTWALAQRIEEGLPKLAGKPALILRGLKDPGYQSGLLTFGAEHFPGAEVHEFEDASHFVQEDAHERIVPLVVDFIKRTGSSIGAEPITGRRLEMLEEKKVARAPASPAPACRMDVFNELQRSRYGELLANLRGAVQRKQELPDGYAFLLADDPTAFREVAEWITLERQCCPFIRFSLEWKAGEAWLLLTGGEGVKEVIGSAMAD